MFWSLKVRSRAREVQPRSEVEIGFRNCCLAGSQGTVDESWSRDLYICCYRSGVS